MAGFPDGLGTTNNFATFLWQWPLLFLSYQCVGLLLLTLTVNIGCSTFRWITLLTFSFLDTPKSSGMWHKSSYISVTRMELRVWFEKILQLSDLLFSIIILIAILIMYISIVNTETTFLVFHLLVICRNVDTCILPNVPKPTLW